MSEEEVTQLLIMIIDNGSNQCEPVDPNSFIVTMPDGEKFRITVTEES